MKRINNTLKLLALILIFSLAGTAQALGATMSLSPGSSSVAQGNILTVSIRENSGSEPINAASATLSYPADKLDFISIGNSSAFSIVAVNSGGGGTVKVERGALPAVTGSQTIATVRFRAKTNSGVANVEITSGSLISANSNTNVYTGGSGGRYTLTASVAQQAQPEPPKDTTAPIIKDLKVVEAGINFAVITWTTSEPATTEVNYGLNTGYGLSATDSNPVTEHKITLNSPLMLPATDYHYMVKSVDPAGNATSSEDAKFSTKGLSVNVSVKNKNGKPVNGATVSIGKNSGKTNKEGVAQVNGLGIGEFSGVVKYKGEAFTFTGSISANEISDKAKTVAVKIDPSRDVLVFVVPLLALLLIAGLYFLKPVRNRLSNYIPSRLRNLGEANHNSSASAPVTTVGDPPVISPTDKK